MLSQLPPAEEEARAYYAALDRLARPIRAAALPHTLAPMIALMRALGDPHRRTPVVLVAGSVGKTTAASAIAYQLHEQGYARVGLYTSPHLHSFRERFALIGGDGLAPDAPPTLITRQAFTALAGQVAEAASALDHPYSTFELATAMAYLWFAGEHGEGGRADIAVMEIGIGGRFDAVNVVNADGGQVRLAVLMPIEHEHAAMLGGTLESIAWHKAGIIPQGGTALYQSSAWEPMPEVVRLEFQRQAHASNALLLHTTLEQPRRAPGRSSHRVYIAPSTWLILNGAHTASAAFEMLHDLHEQNFTQLHIVCGMLKDKAIADFLAVFEQANITFVFTQAPGPRGLAAEAIHQQYLESSPSRYEVEPRVVPDLAEAFELARQAAQRPDTCSIITGSLRMVAAAREYFGLLDAAELDEAQRTRAIFEGEDYQRRSNAGQLPLW